MRQLLFPCETRIGYHLFFWVTWGIGGPSELGWTFKCGRIMHRGVIVVCRMNSSRLPGKTMATIEGRPLLWYVCSRLLVNDEFRDSLCVATSQEWFDEPIAQFCRQQGIPCFRGDRKDVAGRIIACAESRGWDSFARVNGDSPFVDASLLQQAFEALSDGNCDFVTNLAPRTYPYGVAIEVMRTPWYRDWMLNRLDAADREHVTRSIYRNLESVRYRNLPRLDGDLSDWSLTIDTAKHLEWFRELFREPSSDWDQMDYASVIAQRQPYRRVG